MKTGRNLSAVTATVVCCTVIIWLSTSIHGGEKTYEVQPQVTIPEYRTDAARAIDAYEHLMERYMDLTGSNLAGIGADVKYIIKKLDCINEKLTKLSARIRKIEKALKIKQPKKPT